MDLGSEDPPSYLDGFLHPGPFLQCEPLQSDHLALQARHYALPPLEGAVRDPPGQLLQDVKVVAQEPEELLDTQEGCVMLR